MRLLIIDEQDCFGGVKKRAEELGIPNNVTQLEPEYFLAPNPQFFDKMVENSKDKECILLHRVIWADECNSQCIRLDEFEKTVSPTPLLRIGNPKSTHRNCPLEILTVFNQIYEAYTKFGKLIGAKVVPPNPSAWKYLPLEIVKLEIFADGVTVGCSLLQPQLGTKSGLYKLSELRSVKSETELYQDLAGASKPWRNRHAVLYSVLQPRDETRHGRF